MIKDGEIKIRSKKDYDKYFPKPKTPYVESDKYAINEDELEVKKIQSSNKLTISNHHFHKPKRIVKHTTKTTLLEIYRYKNIQLCAENRLLKQQLQLANKKITILNKYNMKFSFITKYKPKTGVSFMSYDKSHTDDYCDKCNKKVGKSKLFKLPYVYCDKNDTMHEDVSYLIGMKNEGYRQYFVCIDCFRKEPK